MTEGICPGAGPGLLITQREKGPPWAWGAWGSQERLESPGAEDLSSSVCVGLEAEPRACQAKRGEALTAGSRRQPWRRTQCRAVRDQGFTAAQSLPNEI